MYIISVLLSRSCAFSPVEVLPQRAALRAGEEGGPGLPLSDCEYLIGSAFQSPRTASIQ